MTTTTERHTVARTAESRSRQRATRTFVGATWLIGGYYWAVILLVTLVIGYFTSRGTIDESIFHGVAQSTRFFLFVMGIILPPTYLGLHVATGGTRRSLVRATWISTAVVGLTFGLAIALGSAAEWLLFRQVGWEYGEFAAPQLYAHGGQVPVVLGVHALACAVYLVVGSCVAMGYYRWGGIRGTVAVPALLVPAAVSELALQSGYFGRPLAAALGVPQYTVPVALLGGLACCVVAGYVFHLLTRDVALRPW